VLLTVAQVLLALRGWRDRGRGNRRRLSLDRSLRLLLLLLLLLGGALLLLLMLLLLLLLLLLLDALGFLGPAHTDVCYFVPGVHHDHECYFVLDSRVYVPANSTCLLLSLRVALSAGQRLMKFIQLPKVHNLKVNNPAPPPLLVCKLRILIWPLESNTAV
jgi:hypothetical protein